MNPQFSEQDSDLRLLKWRITKDGTRHTTKLSNGKFQSQVCINRKNIYVGCFETEEEANAAAVEFLRKEAA